MQSSRDCLVASIQVDLDDDVLRRFREDLLQRVHRTNPKGVILDVSGLEIIDATDFAELQRTMAMVSLMEHVP